MFKINFSVGELFARKSKNLSKMKKLANRIPVSHQVVSRDIIKTDSFSFREERIMKNGTKVTRHYVADEKFKKANLIQKNVIPASNKGKSVFEGGLEYETLYTGAGRFLGTVMCDAKNSSYLSFVKDKITGQMFASRGVGEITKALNSVK